MSAKIIIPADDSGGTYETVFQDCLAIVRKHHERLTRVRIERRRQGPGSGALPKEIEAGREASESVDDHADDVAKRIVELIREDAARPRARGGTGTWLGTVFFLDHNAERKPELAKYEVRIEDPDDFTTVQSEVIGVLAENRKLVADVSRHFANLLEKLKDVAGSLEGIITGVTKSISRENSAAAKYAYKTAKLEARMQLDAAIAQSKAQRAAQMWNALRDILLQYKPVFEEVVHWANTESPKRERIIGVPPTLAELEEVLTANEYNGVRTAMAAILATTDEDELAQLRQTLRSALTELVRLNRIGELRETIRAKLGERRFNEIMAWLNEEQAKR